MQQLHWCICRIKGRNPFIFTVCSTPKMNGFVPFIPPVQRCNRFVIFVTLLLYTLLPTQILLAKSEAPVCNTEEKSESAIEGIEHTTVTVNGIKMHVAQKGQGPVVLFLHGFPEIWYCWRHQIQALSSQGYRAVAPDLRGYGDTEAPASIGNYTIFHIVGDLVDLIDHLSEEPVFLVGHDWGAIIGWHLCMFRPEKIKAYVCLSVPLLPRNPKVRFVDGLCANNGPDYYICRFQEPGKAEAEMAKTGISRVLKTVITSRRAAPPILPKEGFGYNPEADARPLPSWLSEEDLAYYTSKYEKSGFTGPLNYYRNMNQNWELTAPWTGAKVHVPVKYIAGELDSVYMSNGIKQYIQGGAFRKDVPGLKEVIIQEGVAHFNNEEAHQDVSTHIHDFISKFNSSP